MTTKTRKASKNAEADAATDFPTDEYDAAAAARDGAEAAPAAPAEGVANDVVKSERKPLPDPRELMQIALGPDNTSPKTRLFRNHHKQLLAIQFDEKPAEKYTQQLREHGWRWQHADKVWTKPLDRDRRWATQAEAEKLFREIGNAIRSDLGLVPTMAIGQ
jgi:hypothetical protein